MNRKNFLSSLIPLAASAGLPLQGPALDKHLPADGEAGQKVPNYLKPGDTIGITCPAGFITQEDIQPAIQQMHSWGYNIKVGETVGKRDWTFGGTDEERARDFQQLLDDPAVKAIMCARGGYGVIRIIDKLNFESLVSRPKWIIGFSDITVIHCHLNRNFGIATVHSKMCNSFPTDWNLAEPIQVETILSIKQALSGEKMIYRINPNEFNKSGSAEGVLIGGNLKMIETLSGTSSDLKTAGKILFVEDTGEYLYSIDRMFLHLKRTGKLASLKALIVGGFKIKPDDPGEEFGRTLYDIVLSKVKEYQYPVCFDFPVGHQKNNYALKCGVKHKLLVEPGNVILKEI